MTSGAVPTAEQPGAGQVVPRGFGAALTPEYLLLAPTYCVHTKRECLSLLVHTTRKYCTLKTYPIFVTAVAPQSPFLCANRSPILYDFRGSAIATREAWTISLGKKIHIGETTRNDEWQDVSNQAAGHFNRQNWHSRQNMAIPRRQKSHKILGWKLFSFRARHSKPAWMNERFSSIIFAEVVKRKILQCVWSLAHT